jgi:hypothetical protein
LISCSNHDGCIDFNIGNIAIQFVQGFGVWSERRNAIQMTVELQKDDVGEIMEFEFTLDELRSHAQKQAESGSQEEKE